MTTEDKARSGGTPTGFAGFGAFVSDVDSVIAAAAKAAPPQAKQAAAPSGPSAPSQPPPKPNQGPSAAPVDRDRSSNSGCIWAVVIGIGLFLWFIVSVGGNNSSSNQAAAPAPTYATPDPAAPVQVPATLNEEVPTVGSNQVLYGPQLRYCLAESIRLDGSRQTINNYSDSDVNRFNAMVTDYNSRCGSFQYREGALQSAQSEVEMVRAQLLQEGRARFGVPQSSAPALDVVDPYAVDSGSATPAQAENPYSGAFDDLQPNPEASAAADAANATADAAAAAADAAANAPYTDDGYGEPGEPEQADDSEGEYQ